jgi:hypothetical protein
MKKENSKRKWFKKKTFSTFRHCLQIRRTGSYTSFILCMWNYFLLNSTKPKSSTNDDHIAKYKLIMLADELHQEVSFQGHAKWVYGGGDLLRPRTGHRNGVSSLLLRPSSIFSTLSGHVTVCVCLALYIN